MGHRFFGSTGISDSQREAAALFEEQQAAIANLASFSEAAVPDDATLAANLETVGDPLGADEPVPTGRFVRNNSMFDVFTLAHLGVGAGLAILGLSPLALLIIALGTEGVEVLLMREGIIQQETIQNRVGDLISSGIGFAAARALT